MPVGKCPTTVTSDVSDGGGYYKFVLSDENKIEVVKLAKASTRIIYLKRIFVSDGINHVENYIECTIRYAEHLGRNARVSIYNGNDKIAEARRCWRG